MNPAAPRPDSREHGLLIDRSGKNHYGNAGKSRAPAALRNGADGPFVGPIPVNDAQHPLIIKWTLDHRIPSICGDRTYALAWGLMSYWTDWDELRRRTAGYVDRILKGANPGILPIEQPSKFELVVNKKAAKTLGLAIPPSVMLRTDEVI
jgi:putative tryptophan/tyrosine transport system substrate-binding protein